MPDIITQRVLITGAHGMLGGYLRQIFADADILTLGLNQASDIVCDLRKDSPRIPAEAGIECVIHAAGTEEDAEADALNLGGTLRLLDSLSSAPPKRFIFISSHQVYGDEGGEYVETLALKPVSAAGISKKAAEEAVTEWAAENDVTLTILRPALMFGRNIKGEMARLFSDVIAGRYVHIRGNDAKVSVVTALDVARVAQSVYAQGGIYNVTDGRNPKFLELVEAMTMNAGALKRPMHLPAPWASAIWKFMRIVPIVDYMLNPEKLKKRGLTKTLSADWLRENVDLHLYDTLRVISRQEESYPYEEE